MSDARPLRVLMAGPPARSGGGMYAVAASIVDGLQARGSTVAVELLDSGGGLGRAGYRRFPAAVRRIWGPRPDVLHLHVASKGSTIRKAALAAAARVRGIPYVVHLHGGGYADFVDSLHPVGKAAVARFFRGADRVVVLGSVWAELVTTRLGVAPHRVVVVANGVEGCGSGDPGGNVLLFVGDLSRDKGVDDLVDVANRLLGEARFGTWRLRLVGRTPDEGIVAAASEGPAASRIDVTGPLYGSAKEDEMRAASIFVLPSRAEALPMSILEAMSAGVPCVASNVGSVAEVVEDGATGLVVEPGDADGLERALRRLMDDADARRAMGAAGRERWARDFTRDVCAARVERVWRSVVDERAQAGGSPKLSAGAGRS